MKKVNKFLNKYQPTIQTIGILLILITIIISIWQNFLTREQLELSSIEQRNETFPKFNVSAQTNEKDKFNDEIILTNLNSNHVFQSVNIYTLERENLKSFEYYNINFNSRKLKKLIEELSYDYINDYDISFGEFILQKSKSDLLIYPLLFEISYLENENLKKYFLFYNYVFQIYFNGDDRKIKTIGLDYNQSFKLSDDDSAKKIHNFLLTNSFKENTPFNNDNFLKDIKLNILKKDSLKSAIYALYDINTYKGRYESVLKINDTLSFPVYYLKPLFLDKVKLGKQRDSILLKIKMNREFYSRDVLSQIKLMNDSIKMFERMSVLDSILETNNNETQIFKYYENIWDRMNEKLIENALNELQIN